MVSEPSELNIVYAVVQCTGHHMGKSGTKTLHVITPLKDVYKRNVVIKSSGLEINARKLAKCE